jgi:hypothetical protein
MMICLIALFVFGVLAIFSAKYRIYFKEAADCVFKRLTLRKCTTSFDKKMKVKISSKISNKNKRLGGFVFRHFEALSWIMTIAMILSLIWTAYTGFVGVYNFYWFGNCNGPNSPELCIYNSLTGTTGSTSSAYTAYNPAFCVNPACPDCNIAADGKCDSNCVCAGGACQNSK